MIGRSASFAAALALAIVVGRQTLLPETGLASVLAGRRRRGPLGDPRGPAGRGGARRRARRRHLRGRQRPHGLRPRSGGRARSRERRHRRRPARVPVVAAGRRRPSGSAERADPGLRLLPVPRRRDRGDGAQCRGGDGGPGDVRGVGRLGCRSRLGHPQPRGRRRHRRPRVGRPRLDAPRDATCGGRGRPHPAGEPGRPLARLRPRAHPPARPSCPSSPWCGRGCACPCRSPRPRGCSSRSARWSSWGGSGVDRSVPSPNGFELSLVLQGYMAITVGLAVVLGTVQWERDHLVREIAQSARTARHPGGGPRGHHRDDPRRPDRRRPRGPHPPEQRRGAAVAPGG